MMSGQLLSTLSLAQPISSKTTAPYPMYTQFYRTALFIFTRPSHLTFMILHDGMNGHPLLKLPSILLR